VCVCVCPCCKHVTTYYIFSNFPPFSGTPVYLPPEVLREERVTNKLVVLSAKVIK
jgi:hypothetical protein